MTLYEMTGAAARLYDLLQSGDIDEQVYADTLEAIGTEEKLESYCKIWTQLETDAANYAEEIRRMTERKKTLESNIERMKEAVGTFLRATGQDKAKAGTFTVSFGRSKAVNVYDETKIPERFLKPQPPKIDRVAIKDAINAGETIEGAEIVVNEGVRKR